MGIVFFWIPQSVYSISKNGNEEKQLSEEALVILHRILKIPYLFVIRISDCKYYKIKSCIEKKVTYAVRQNTDFSKNVTGNNGQEETVSVSSYDLTIFGFQSLSSLFLSLHR